MARISNLQTSDGWNFFKTFNSHCFSYFYDRCLLFYILSSRTELDVVEDQLLDGIGSHSCKMCSEMSTPAGNHVGNVRICGKNERFGQ